MKISVKVVSRARQERVEQSPDGSYKVRVTVVPERGKANERVIELLSEYLNKPKTHIQIIRGQTSSNKIFEVL